MPIKPNYANKNTNNIIYLTYLLFSKINLNHTILPI